MEAILIPLIVFGSFFGIMYVFFTTRNKERLALIEKGADASLFNTGQKSGRGGFLTLSLNLGILAIGIGVGVLLGELLHMGGMDGDVSFPAAIFVCGGIGLVTAYFLTRKVEKEPK